jgi:2-oxoacid:acceptor oxidoreductase gamma subunit (pyruvate/2-ketoisovalerate family)
MDTLLDLRDVIARGTLEIRGDGKAGGGLILAFQSLAALLLQDPTLHVQEWPFFSSARRGANIRSFMRVSARPITAACEVTRPTVALLMNEGATAAVDFAEGVPDGGTFVINTRHSPAECAQHFKLSGRVFTVPGDDIGLKHLKAPLGNVSAFVALTHALGGLDPDAVGKSFLASLRKRRIPDSVIERNRAALDASRAAVRSGVYRCAGPADHTAAQFAGYGALPVGAQSPLRLSLGNRTANYAPSGFRLKFDDPSGACTGCAHCITHCPEGVIHFVPDDRRGLLVTGVDVTNHCKLCGECIAVCPEHLFQQLPYEEAWGVRDEEPVAP